MNTLRFTDLCLVLLPLCGSLVAAETPAMSASELAARLSAKQEGTSYIRVRMDTGGSEKGTLQLQIKSRAAKAGADLVYQVLFPKERKGEAVLLHRAGGRLSGTLFIPPETVRPITPGQLDEPLFGS